MSCGRCGRARAPDGRTVYAVGDVHGRADLLGDILAQMARDKPAAGGKVAVFLGDYVDRGPDSRHVLETLASWDLPDASGVFLRGNHEELMLAALSSAQDGRAQALWLANGGSATLRSYGAETCAQLAEMMPKHHRRFLANLRTHHREGDYLFVHAGLRPGVPLGMQKPEDLTWIREPFLSSGEDHGYCVVHGHTPANMPQERDSRIGIDTGACYGGYLTALVLEGAQRRFLQA